MIFVMLVRIALLQIDKLFNIELNANEFFNEKD